VSLSSVIVSKIILSMIDSDNIH